MNGLTGLALGKLDVLTGLPEIKVCLAYRADDKELEHFPASAKLLERCEPIYRSFPGWSQPIEDARQLEDLPQEARDYIHWIEDALEIPADLIGVGPERDATIERANPFDVTSRSPDV